LKAGKYKESGNKKGIKFEERKREGNGRII
jgi:hypothetical protein